MDLESVRYLKVSLAQKLLASLTTVAHARALPGEAVRSLGPQEDTPPTVALGVAVVDATISWPVRQLSCALERSREVELITRQAKGEVDVRYIGTVTKRAAPPWYRQRQRPLRIGCSVGHFKVTAGTLGAFVRPSGNGSTAIPLEQSREREPGEEGQCCILGRGPTTAAKARRTPWPRSANSFA